MWRRKTPSGSITEIASRRHITSNATEELKLDGYRALAIKTGTKVHLRSRNNNDFALKYPAVVEALAGLPDETVIDGEVVAFDVPSVFEPLAELRFLEGFDLLLRVVPVALFVMYPRTRRVPSAEIAHLQSFATSAFVLGLYRRAWVG